MFRNLVFGVRSLSLEPFRPQIDALIHRLESTGDTQVILEFNNHLLIRQRLKH